MGVEDELGSFVIYSMIIYPLVGYVLSPDRKYQKWKGIGLAILIFAGVTCVQLAYDAHQNGPNYYQRLHIDRDASLATIKKSFKKLSLEYHPDKNRSPEAVHKYLPIKTAYEILIDQEKRDIYNRLGERGLEMAQHNSIGVEILLIRVIISTATSLFFTFLLTISDPSGHSMTLSILSIAIIFVFELKFILLGTPIPPFILPSLTPHNLLMIAHTLKPAIMHSSKAIFSSLYVNPLDILSRSVSSVTTSQKAFNGKFIKLVKQIQNTSQKSKLVTTTPEIPTVEGLEETTDKQQKQQQQHGNSEGLVQGVLETLRLRVARVGDQKEEDRGIERVQKIMSNSSSNSTQENQTPRSPSVPFPLYYLLFYFLARWFFFENKSSQSS